MTNNPLVSIVTGTYNRLPYLMQMVDSFRKSIGLGLSYEFVIVDGGSTDSTQTWCKSQKDINLIEQGELLGACKAFNDGAKAAKGDYVILANDDVIVYYESVLRAIAFMQDNPRCGIGCFYQDRGNQPWHVGMMGAMVDGKITSVPYGQICIIPRYLGNKVGWWGDYLKTYAGDNEMSCNVWNLGYLVEPIPCTCVHDVTVDDELRKINAGDVNYHPAGGHPDSIAWVKKWQHKGFVGPIVDTISNNQVTTVTGKPRVLYCPILEPGHRELQKSRRTGLRDALSKKYWTVEIDYIEDPMYLFDMANMWKPNIIITQFHDAKIYTKESILQLRKENPHAILINWNGDYFPENFLSSNYMKMMKEYDVCGFVQTVVEKKYNNAGINWKYWQIGYEPSSALPTPKTPRHDVLFLANGHSPFRKMLGKELRSMKDINVGLYGSWTNVASNGYNTYDFDAGEQLYRSCKIALSDWRPGATGWVSNRLFQAMAAGAFLLQQRFDGMELLGLKENKHLVLWNDVIDLKDKIKYWLGKPEERAVISKTGQEFVLEHHSFDKRVEEMDGFIDELIQRKVYS
jgi:glycosyltransferase involved in cell wall biosynthesis